MMTHRHSAMRPKEFLLKILRRASLPLIVIGLSKLIEEMGSLVGGLRSPSGGPIETNSYNYFKQFEYSLMSCNSPRIK